MPFNTGDTVRLKSGGPSMTVSWELQTDPTEAALAALRGENPRTAGRYYHCKWFAGRKLSEGEFSEEELVPIRVEGDADR